MRVAGRGRGDTDEGCGARALSVRARPGGVCPPQIDGVRAINNVHVWQLYGDKSVMSAHIVVSGTANPAFVLIKAKMALSKCGINSSTIEMTVLGNSSASGAASPAASSDAVAPST